jgi:hypothetical protein
MSADFAVAAVGVPAMEFCRVTSAAKTLLLWFALLLCEGASGVTWGASGEGATGSAAGCATTGSASGTIVPDVATASSSTGFLLGVLVIGGFLRLGFDLLNFEEVVLTGFRFAGLCFARARLRSGRRFALITTTLMR